MTNNTNIVTISEGDNQLIPAKTSAANRENLDIIYNLNSELKNVIEHL